MIIWGWTGMSHDASLAVFKLVCKGLTDKKELKLLFAAHSERYSRIKNDKNLHPDLISEALTYGEPTEIYYYENPWLKKTRQLYAGQYKLLRKESPTTYMRRYYVDAPKSTTTSHHLSHAAAGYYTSKFDNAAVLVVDSIGEWDTISVWHGKKNKLKRTWHQTYPDSVGIWYSAMTQRLGLKPQEHEYILMGMAAIGKSKNVYHRMRKDFILKMPTVDDPRVLFKDNYHRGCMGWAPELTSVQDYADIAAATQRLYEEIFDGLVQYTKKHVGTDNLVLMGGCILNCVANNIATKYYKNVWIMPNPGDAGSAIGAVLAHKKQFINYDVYSGTDISGVYPIQEVIDELLENKITAVASGRAEFGPRALGHRSILADPRGVEVKDRVNNIKHREAFRPFAPMILAEDAHDYFEMPVDSSPYMQYIARCKHPDLFPAIIHYDGTSRVQTVGPNDCPDVRALLIKWKRLTGCPMLLNTSLNIKGEPLVNTRADAERWETTYGVKVCLPKL
jgi:carbamoyltransferase